MSHELFPKELIEDLKSIYKYFGGLENKLEKLYQESGEFRDIWLLRDKTVKLMPEVREEIADIISVALQIYIDNPVIQDEVKRVVAKTIFKINSGYYAKN